MYTKLKVGGYLPMDEITASPDIWWCVNTNSEEKLLRKLQGDMTMSEIKKRKEIKRKCMLNFMKRNPDSEIY